MVVIQEKVRFQRQPVYSRRGQRIVSLGGEPVKKGWRLRGKLRVQVGDEVHFARASVLLSSETETAIKEAKREVSRLVRAQALEIAAQRSRSQIEARCGEIGGEVARIETASRRRVASVAPPGASQDPRRTSLTCACLRYCDDPDVEANPQTRRIYRSYIRNHIAVPASVGDVAIGDLQLREIDLPRLKAWKKTLCAPRTGFRATAEDDRLLEAYLNDPPFEVQEHRKPALSNVSFKKVLLFLSAVLNWAKTDPTADWQAPAINVAQEYAGRITITKKKLQFAPSANHFARLVEAAERIDLAFMIPFMALVRCAFRPCEARGVRWQDIEIRRDQGKERTIVHVHGEIVWKKGGELWLPVTKTEASNDHVVLPESVANLLRKHRREGCEYVVPPAPRKTNKGKAHPFLSRDGYATAWNRLCEEVGLPEGTDPYSLKHGLITELLLTGGRDIIESIPLMTRHTTLEQVRRIYNTIQSGHLADKVDEMHAGARG